jgi:glucan 1,3-beta-glucosidase
MTPSFLPAVAITILGLTFISSATAFNPGFPYGSQKVRGVNLGGWLVLEVCSVTNHAGIANEFG